MPGRRFSLIDSRDAAVSRRDLFGLCPFRLNRDSLLARCGGAPASPQKFENDRQDRDEDDSDNNDVKSFFDAWEIAQEITAEQERGYPGDSTNDVVDGESRILHLADTGYERRKRPNDRNKPC